MIDVEYIKFMARYTCWQNDSLVTAASALSDDDRRMDRGAFFGSIFETFNHILWADEAWLSRLADHPVPKAPGIPGSRVYKDGWDDFVAARANMDAFILDWSGRVTPADLVGEYRWFSPSAGREVEKDKARLFVHMFNHGTHHRGQIHAMLTAAGAKPDDTDIPFMPARFEEM